MKKILEILKKAWKATPKWLLAIVIAIAVALITKNIAYGFFTLFGIVALLTAFVMGRQLYWWLTSTGDYLNRSKRIVIKKGKHYPFPGFLVPVLKYVKKEKETKMERTFKFTESCFYDLQNENQLDTNKLFGFSIGNHHNTSFRFGWRPNLLTHKIQILKYEYQDGIRTIFPLCEVDADKWVSFGIYYNPKGFCKYVASEMIDENAGQMNVKISPVNVKRKHGFGYRLGLYFGGNETAPQDVVVYKKIK